MEYTLKRYIVDGVIGELEIGMTRQNIVNRLGSPVDWKGKPPTIGPVVDKWQETDVWFYYMGGCGVRFGAYGTAVEVILYPEKVNNKLPPFEKWPTVAGYTMGMFRRDLIEAGIMFVEEWQGKGSLHYIRAAKKCFAYSAYYRNGVALHPDEQEIILIGNLADTESTHHYTLS